MAPILIMISNNDDDDNSHDDDNGDDDDNSDANDNSDDDDNSDDQPQKTITKGVKGHFSSAEADLPENNTEQNERLSH